MGVCDAELATSTPLATSASDAMTFPSTKYTQQVNCMCISLFPISALFLKRPTGSLHHAFHLRSQLRNSTGNLLRQHIPKTSKSLGFAFEELVVLHGVLDEFTRVDVRISSLLNVAYDVLRDVNMA